MGHSKLWNICQNIIYQNSTLLPEGHPLNTRLVCPEYSKSEEEVKTYPFLENDHIFMLCWNFSDTSSLAATMCPSPKPFRSQFHFRNGTKTQLHTHDYLELGYVVNGEFRQKILGKDITFNQGDFCLIDKNCLHQDYLFSSSATILFLGIANDMFTEIMDKTISTQKMISFLQTALIHQKDLQQYIHFRPASNTSIERMEDCLGHLIKELFHNEAGSYYIRKGLLFRIFRLLSTEYDFSLSREQRKTMNWIIFEEITDYMKRNYSHITLQDLCNEFHFQEDYFNRLIKTKTGMTYSAYLQQIRLEKASSLLTHTTMTVDEICDTVGYKNKGFFYKIFKEKYGLNPAGYRKEHNL